MATPQKAVLRPVTAEEWAALERIAKASSERLDRVRRALAVLAVAQGEPFVRAAQQAGFQSGTTIANLVSRFNQHGLGALSIAAGRGRKPTYDPAARAQIVTVAQRAPDRKADGTATWSLSTLQRTLRQEAFPRLGATTIRRVLQDAGSSYQQTRTWCPTGTAERKRKRGIVRVTDPQTEEKRG
jgi:transposase